MPKPRETSPSRDNDPDGRTSRRDVEHTADTRDRRSLSPDLRGRSSYEERERHYMRHLRDYTTNDHVNSDNSLPDSQTDHTSEESLIAPNDVYELGTGHRFERPRPPGRRGRKHRTFDLNADNQSLQDQVQDLERSSLDIYNDYMGTAGWERKAHDSTISFEEVYNTYMGRELEDSKGKSKEDSKRWDHYQLIRDKNGKLFTIEPLDGDIHMQEADSARRKGKGRSAFTPETFLYPKALVDPDGDIHMQGDEIPVKDVPFFYEGEFKNEKRHYSPEAIKSMRSAGDEINQINDCLEYINLKKKNMEDKGIKYNRHKERLKHYLKESEEENMYLVTEKNDKVENKKDLMKAKEDIERKIVEKAYKSEKTVKRKQKEIVGMEGLISKISYDTKELESKIDSNQKRIGEMNDELEKVETSLEHIRKSTEVTERHVDFLHGMLIGGDLAAKITAIHKQLEEQIKTMQHFEASLSAPQDSEEIPSRAGFHEAIANGQNIMDVLNKVIEVDRKYRFFMDQGEYIDSLQKKWEEHYYHERLQEELKYHREVAKLEAELESLKDPVVEKLKKRKEDLIFNDWQLFTEGKRSAQQIRAQMLEILQQGGGGMWQNMPEGFQGWFNQNQRIVDAEYTQSTDLRNEILEIDNEIENTVNPNQKKIDEIKEEILQIEKKTQEDPPKNYADKIKEKHEEISRNVIKLKDEYSDAIREYPKVNGNEKLSGNERQYLTKLYEAIENIQEAGTDFFSVVRCRDRYRSRIERNNNLKNYLLEPDNQVAVALDHLEVLSSYLSKEVHEIITQQVESVIERVIVGIENKNSTPTTLNDLNSALEELRAFNDISALSIDLMIESSESDKSAQDIVPRAEISDAGNAGTEILLDRDTIERELGRGDEFWGQSSRTRWETIQRRFQNLETRSPLLDHVEQWINIIAGGNQRSDRMLAWLEVKQLLSGEEATEESKQLYNLIKKMLDGPRQNGG